MAWATQFVIMFAHSNDDTQLFIRRNNKDISVFGVKLFLASQSMSKKIALENYIFLRQNFQKLSFQSLEVWHAGSLE